jgi:hypothetical protein
MMAGARKASEWRAHLLMELEGCMSVEIYTKQQLLVEDARAFYIQLMLEAIQSSKSCNGLSSCAYTRQAEARAPGLHLLTAAVNMYCALSNVKGQP